MVEACRGEGAGGAGGGVEGGGWGTALRHSIPSKIITVHIHGVRVFI